MEDELKSLCWSRQYSDQMQCDLCNLTWDVNDSFPPSCIASIELKRAARNGWIRIGELSMVSDQK